MTTMRSFLALTALCCSLLGLPLTSAQERHPLEEILPSKLQNAKGEKVDLDSLKGKTVALYFSAHWCPPCRAFTPKLVAFRDQHADQDFEVVFVSLDNSESERKNYIKGAKMNWLMVPGAQSPEAEALANRFQIRGIPALIVLSPEGTLVTREGRLDVMSSPETALQQWKEKDPS